MRTARLHLWAFVLALILFPAFVCGEFPTSRPFPGVGYATESRKDPAMRLYCVMVDLTNSAVSLHVSRGGPDPDGNGPFQTTLMRTSEIAARERFDIAINGSFFAAKSKVDEEGALLRYAVGQPASVIGPAMSDGTLWAKGSGARPCLIVTDRGEVLIAPSTQIPHNARQIVSGNTLLVENGKAVANSSKQIAPRTAVGLDKGHKRLVVLIVDGRLPGFSIGMSYAQVAAELISLGCHTAINLDGGGSTTLVLRDPKTQQFRVINTPSDGTERPIANVLGVKIKQ
ncbi:MAG: phosphodiester glycosidase family protein [Bacillota bacterium]